MLSSSMFKATKWARGKNPQPVLEISSITTVTDWLPCHSKFIANEIWKNSALKTKSYFFIYVFCYSRTQIVKERYCATDCLSSWLPLITILCLLSLRNLQPRIALSLTFFRIHLQSRTWNSSPLLLEYSTSSIPSKNPNKFFFSAIRHRCLFYKKRREK